MTVSTREIALAPGGALAQLAPSAGVVDVTIEIIGENIGDQIEAQHLPWHGLIFDEANDVIEVSVGGSDGRVPVTIRHRIDHPLHVWAEEVDGSLHTISIESKDGIQTLLRFHDRHAIGR